MAAPSNPKSICFVIVSQRFPARERQWFSGAFINEAEAQIVV